MLTRAAGRHVHAGVHAYRGLRLQPSVSVIVHPLFRQGLSLALSSPIWLVWLAGLFPGFRDSASQVLGLQTGCPPRCYEPSKLRSTAYSGIQLYWLGQLPQLPATCFACSHSSCYLVHDRQVKMYLYCSELLWMTSFFTYTLTHSQALFNVDKY